MRRLQTLLLLLCLAVTSTVWAESISESQAKSIAAKFMANHGMTTSRLKMAHKAPSIGAAASSGKAAYYVFNGTRSNSGFIIVAGDDRAPEVLGYSDRGTFDVNDVPLAMQEWLDGYAAQIEELDKGAQAALPLKALRPISPLVKACWSQNNPFNILLPILSNGKHAYVGCVATAMAQLMHYWQWPACPTSAIPTYTSSSLGIEMPELPIVNFDWNIMQNTYQTTDTTSASAMAAATLSLYCAQAMEMDFKTSGSGATTARVPMRMAQYFDYKNGHALGRTSYTSQEWADALYSELAAARPIIYSGHKSTSGHAFICDGYDGNGMFHINWGWNGQSNGYFLLNVLNPDLQGTGSASGAYGYIYSQAAVVGLEPGTETSEEVMFTISNLKLNSLTTSRTSIYDDFTAVISGHFYNYTSHVFAANFGWGLYQDSTLIDVIYNTYTSASTPGKYFNLSEKEMTFGSGITSGTYRIVAICSERAANNWKPCLGSDKNYIEVTIDGNTCTSKGYGTAATLDYTVNDITYNGYLHHNRPVDINVNMTNNGESDNVLLYMFVNGTFTSTGYVGLVPGETGDISFRFVPENPGTLTLTFSFNEDGSDPIATRTLTISQMPAANLSGTIQVLNVSSGNIINSDKFSVLVTVTNNGSTTYNEDISIKLYKNTYDNHGTTVQAINQPLTLAAGATQTIQFDLDNVIDGWKYFVYTYYYSSGTQETLKGSSSYTIVFPEVPEVIIGDVNGDGQVTIKDVTDLIDYLLSGSGDINPDAADCSQDGNITIKDVTDLIDLLLQN